MNLEGFTREEDTVTPGNDSPREEKGERPGPDEIWELRLYVAGTTPKSIEAFSKFEKNYRRFIGYGTRTGWAGPSTH
jgi:hypothetical protein